MLLEEEDSDAEMFKTVFCDVTGAVHQEEVVVMINKLCNFVTRHRSFDILATPSSHPEITSPIMSPGHQVTRSTVLIINLN